MFSIDSTLWRVRTLNTAQLAVIQKASGAMRVVGLSALPHLDTLAAVSERRFDALCREAFHGRDLPGRRP